MSENITIAEEHSAAPCVNVAKGLGGAICGPGTKSQVCQKWHLLGSTTKGMLATLRRSSKKT